MKFKIIILFLLFFAQVSLLSQNGSVYTRFGLGDVDYSYSARRLGFGEAGVSISDIDFISPVNPAGWYRLNRTRLETGLSYNGFLISDVSNKKYFAETDFTGFTFAFPVSSLHGIGVALGLVPFSNVGYNVLQKFESTDPLIGDYEVKYSGKGGLSKLFIGSSYKFPFDVSIGAVLDYYFGSLNYSTNLKFEKSNIAAAEYRKSYNPHGIGGTIGLISPDLSSIFNSENLTDVRLGASANLFSDFTTDTSHVLTDSFGADTLISGTTAMQIPIRAAFGLSFVLSSKYLFMIDYIYQPWSEYTLNSIASSNLRNSNKFNLGFEYRPLRDLGLTIWEQIIFRAGVSFEQTPYLINGEGINEFSVAGGLSFPLSFENTIDIGFQFSMRGTTESNLLKEDIFKLNVGISLGEIWFIRQEK